MNRKGNLYLLILCLILFQEICALSGKNEKSENPHIRKKRIIGSQQISIQAAPYALQILANGVYCCVATLLSPNFALTAAHCLMHEHHAEYIMLSSRIRLAHGIRHNITNVIRHEGFNSDADIHDLSLFSFLPHINDHSPNRPIKLYHGVLPPKSRGTVAGWGYHMIRGGEKHLPEQLMATTMTIISQDECHRLYRDSINPISDHYICTFDNGEKQCDDGDSGAPLVVNGALVGIMSWNEEEPCRAFPDVFMNLLLPMYRNWIARFVPSAFEHRPR